MLSGDLAPVVLLALAVAAIVAVMTLRLRARPGAPAREWTPVPVPPEEVELEEGAVHACMRCGSPRVRPANLSEGGIPGGGAGLAWICDRCGRRGPAIEFADPTAYRQFVKGLHEAREPETAPEERS